LTEAQSGSRLDWRWRGFALLGIGLVGYGALRQTLVVRTIRRGEYVELDGRVVVGLAAAMIVLGIALAVVVVFR